MSLVSAIDSLVECVRNNLGEQFFYEGGEADEMKNKLSTLSGKVFVEAVGLELESHLPGEHWGSVVGKCKVPINGTMTCFGLMERSDWFADMDTLRNLAESKTKKSKTGRPKVEETDSDKKIIGAIKVLLNERGVDAPPMGKDIVEKSGVRNVSRFIRKIFLSQKEFEAAWRRNDVRGKLAKLEYLPENHVGLREGDGVSLRKDQEPEPKLDD